MVGLLQPALLTGFYGANFSNASPAADFVRLLSVFVGFAAAMTWTISTQEQQFSLVCLWMGNTLVHVFIVCYGTLSYFVFLSTLVSALLTYLHCVDAGFVQPRKIPGVSK